MSDGLAGAFRRGTSGIIGSIKNHDNWAIRLVFFAGFITILQKAGVPVPHYAAAFAVALGVAALLYEMNAATYALRSFWNGRPVGMVGWSAIWLCAFAYSAVQWSGAASQNEANKTNLHKAAYEMQVDTRKALNDAESKLAGIKGRISGIEGWSVNGQRYIVRTADAAQADIDNAKAHKFWTTTAACTSTKGPQTRAFCDAYNRAKTEKSLAIEMATLREELKAAEAEVAQARTAAGTGNKVFSEARSDLALLKRVSNLSDADAEMFSGAFAILIISVFLSFATMLREMEHLRATQKRVPLFRVRAWWAAFYRFWTGKDIAPAGNVHVETRRMTVGQLAGLA